MKSIPKCPGNLGQAKNTQAYRQLVKSYSARLFQYGIWLCNDKGEAERLVENSFLQAWKSIDNNGQGYCSKLQLFRNLHQAYCLSSPGSTLKTKPLNPNLNCINRKKEDSEFSFFQRALEKISAKNREPLVLQLIGEFSSEEIASICNISTQQVMTRIYNAKRQLISDSFSEDLLSNFMT